MRNGSLVRTPAREMLVRDLLVNGPIFDKEGHATSKLIKRMGARYTNPRQLNGVMRDAEKDGIIQRLINHRRTYKIWLVNNPWPDLEDAAIEELENGYDEDDEVKEFPKPLPITDKPLPTFDADAVADSLLKLVIQTVTEGSKTEELQTQIHLLGKELQAEKEGREKFRQLLRESQDDLRAKVLENEGLRKNVNTLGFQLDQVLKDQRKAQRIALDDGATQLLKDLMSAPGGRNDEL